jgi:hypothetical protein
MKYARSDRRFATSGNPFFLSTVFVLIILSYPVTRAAAALPDLIINRPRLARTLFIQKRTFNPDDCAVIENCISGVGERKLLLFAVGFVNIGGNLRIGRPENHPELFEYSPCHGHYHLSGAARYVLRRSDGTKVVGGRKQAFCFRDTVKYSSAAGPAKYDCEVQGITAGWEDVYYRNLDCQWLDITGVPRGNYLLTVVVNPLRVFQESNYSNNSATVPVFIP